MTVSESVCIWHFTKIVLWKFPVYGEKMKKIGARETILIAGFT